MREDHLFFVFLVAYTRLYNLLRRSVGPSVTTFDLSLFLWLPGIIARAQLKFTCDSSAVYPALFVFL